MIEDLDQPSRWRNSLPSIESTLAQVVRFEMQALSYDRDYWDAAKVLELLNVELLEPY